MLARAYLVPSVPSTQCQLKFAHLKEGKEKKNTISSTLGSHWLEKEEKEEGFNLQIDNNHY